MIQTQLQNEFEGAFELLESLRELPEGFSLKFAHEVNLDRRPLWWFRFEKEDRSNNGLEGEHYTALVDCYNQRLMGFTYLDCNSACPVSPDDDRSSDMAWDFFRKNAPDIVDNLELKWVQMLSEVAKKPPHDSAMYYLDKTTGEKQTLLGTRVKFFDKTNGLYAWVVVTDAGEVINFERDIKWSVLRGRRVSEVWLHDAYPTHPGRKVIHTDSAKLMEQLTK